MHLWRGGNCHHSLLLLKIRRGEKIQNLQLRVTRRSGVAGEKKGEGGVGYVYERAMVFIIEQKTQAKKK